MNEDKDYEKIIAEIKRIAQQEQIEKAQQGNLFDLERVSQTDGVPTGKVYKVSRKKKQKISSKKELNKPTNQQPKWALKHDRCIKCKTIKRPHRARGLCEKCYELENRKNHRIKTTYGERRRREKPTKEQLQELYIIQSKSLREIGEKLRYSAQGIRLLLKEYNIPIRNQSEARTIAYDKGKIAHDKTLSSGETITVTHQKIICNESFFDSWYPKMAYVLGVIYADGYLIKRINTVGGFGIGQKEPELLEKVLNLMDSNATLYFTEEKKYKKITAGELYRFNIRSEHLFKQLVRLGLHTKKSRTVNFPIVPDCCLRHFIRGCWDGDGSFYIEKQRDKLRGDFVSGSKLFITELADRLYGVGFKKFTIHRKHRTKKPSYYIKVSHKDCIKLYHYFYDNVPETMYLSRKYNVFKDYLNSN
ncbi:LAGLIDADG family homing endonuclease [Thermodesulfobacteriota bacterium]